MMSEGHRILGQGAFCNVMLTSLGLRPPPTRRTYQLDGEIRLPSALDFAAEKNPTGAYD